MLLHAALLATLSLAAVERPNASIATNVSADRCAIAVGGTETFAFDGAPLVRLRPGEELPASHGFEAEGLRLLQRRPIRDGEHFLFEDPANRAREASLLLRGGRLTGTISREGTLRSAIDTIAPGVIRVRLVDAANDLPCGFDPTLHHAHDHAHAADGGIAGACDDGSTIDLFVGYTAAAESQAGGTTQVEDWILWAVADSNAIYAASGVPVTLRLLGTMKTASVENESMIDDVYQVQAPDDGAFDDVLAAGAAAGADLVALTRADGGGACGVAFLIGGSVEDVALAVSVTALGCFPNKTFTHELGHNMGCCHAPGDGGGCFDGGVFPYSVGHRFDGQDGQLYRTVMAYAPGTRIGRFSSPTVIFEGTPTGIADERDNARTISETRFVVANFRCPACAGDLDGSGAVDGADLAVLLGGWGETSAGGDLDNDGDTDGADLATLLGAWGECP